MPDTSALSTTIAGPFAAVIGLSLNVTFLAFAIRRPLSDLIVTLVSVRSDTGISGRPKIRPPSGQLSMVTLLMRMLRQIGVFGVTGCGGSLPGSLGVVLFG